MEADIFPFVLAFFFGAILSVFFLHLLYQRKELKHAPQGSMGWPLVGETLGFLRPHKSNSIGSFLQEHTSRYGKVFRSHLFGSATIVSCDHELNSFILQNEEKLFECSYPKAIHGVLGKLSMLVVTGEEHKRLRNIILGLTNSWKCEDNLRNIDEQALSVMKAWHGRQDIIFAEEARKFTFNVIVKQILSLIPEEPRTVKILQDFLTFMKGLVSFPVYIPGTSYAKAVKARARISSTVEGIVHERRKREAGSEKGDFLDVLLSTRSLCDKERVSLVLDLLLGGYETTSLLMTLVVFFIGNCPTALEQLKEEHRAIKRRKKEGEHLNLEDFKQMEFTQNVIHESLRCGNIVKFVHRKALKDVNFKGYVIPSGWKVLPIFSVMHLDPSLHEQPLEFLPGRWVGQGSSKRFAPFGGGPRMCPGAELAKVEVAFFLHHLVLKFRWRIEGEDYPIAYPYVEFQRGLVLRIEQVENES
ncbi:cytochrome P450 724B1 [Aristolochia californica]|uniref:cytochrome P450 724B1 n=1 Tax=Aristolochia californica TaxID=171875 RepID=UPI0035DE8DBB